MKNKILILLATFLLYSCGNSTSNNASYMLVYKIHYSCNYIKQDTLVKHGEISFGSFEGYNYIGGITTDYRIETTAPIEIVYYNKISE